MTGPDDPWEVDGVSDAARDAAEAAAREEGMSLSDWIENTIRTAVKNSSGGVSSDDIVAAIEALSARVAEAENTTQDSVEPLREQLTGLSQQITEIEELAARKPDHSGDGTS